MTPALMITAPALPAAFSNTYARGGLPRDASSCLVITPMESTETVRYIRRTHTKDTAMALPTSLGHLALADTAAAPSIPTNAQRDIPVVAFI